MKAITSRWRAVRNLKSNLVLVVVGCLLMLLAVAWRLALAPALKVEPTDFDQILFYDGTLTQYVNPPGQPVVNEEPLKIPVRIDRTLLGKPIESTPNISVVEGKEYVVAPDTRQEFSTNQRYYAIDRKTGEMVNAKKLDRERSGYLLVFPFNTPRGTVQLWSELTGKTYPAKYRKSEVINKLSVYMFTMSYGNQPVTETPVGYPAEMSGAQLKQVLTMPDLQVADGDTVKPVFTASETVSLLVEPRAGNIVGRRGDESVSLTVKKPGGDLLVTRLLYKLEYAQSKASVADSVNFARDEVSKLNLQFVYIPLGLLVLGLAILVIGAFAGVKVDQ